MDPQYFAHTLSLYEAKLWLKGYRRRAQMAWELARYQGFYSAAPHCKNFTFAEMGKFPWEETAEPVEEMSEEEKLAELAALRQRAKERDERLMKIHDGIG